ncbi:MAG: carbamoyltransferase N-terminal domain-containing protein, partial [Chloroflexota bacterium]
MYTLGVNAAYHDPAACLVRDGQVIAAAEEERFTRIKHGKRPIPFSTYLLPHYAIDYCLREAGITLKDVDNVAYAYDPYLLLREHQTERSLALPLEPSANPTPAEWESAWDPLFLASIVNAPRHLVDNAPFHIQERFRGARTNGQASFQWRFVAHHLAHAASAFLASPFEEAAVMTIDGRGERATTAYYRGQGSRLEPLGQVEMPSSLGLLYERVTEHLGFLHSQDEYKVMALASFGRPVFLDAICDAIHIGPGGAYTIDPLDLPAVFGPARRRGEPLEQRHYDIAHSLQAALERSVIQLAGWLRQAGGSSRLCLAGGVALNCVMNARLRQSGRVDEIWVQPAAG